MGCGLYADGTMQCCEVDTVLHQQYVSYNPDSPKLIAVTGSVNLVVGNRRLSVGISDGSGRVLETSTEEREFQEEFVMVSGASTKGAIVSAGVAAIAALALVA